MVELDRPVSPDVFIASLQGSGLEIYPDQALNFASTDAEGEGGVTQAVYDLDENLMAAQAEATGENVLVALLDNGVDLSHNDLQGHLTDGWDVFHNTANTVADGATFGEAHGTHVAGIIASVAPDARIMPIQISEYGISYVSTVIEGIQYAEDHGAVIANCSWTTEEYNPLLEAVMADSPLFFVAAAGNDARYIDKTPVYPASFDMDNVISVTSIGQDCRLSYFSTYGTGVDIAAWGDEVESTMPGNSHGTLSGTSMAAAYVSGAAALAVSNGTAVSALKGALKKSADKLEYMDGYISDGNVLNLYSLVNDITPREKLSAPAAASAYSSARNGKVIDIHGGSDFYTTLTSAGEIFSWGSGLNGQLGNGLRTGSRIPVEASTKFDRDFMYDEAGNHAHLCGGASTVFLVSPSGEGYGWGWNISNLIKIYGYGNYVTFPVKLYIEPLKNVVAGNDFALYQLLDGRVFRSGNDLGYNNPGTWDFDAPYAELPEQCGAKQIAAGGHLAMTLMDSGEVFAWGTPLSKDEGFSDERVYIPTSLNEAGDSYKAIAVSVSNGALLTVDDCVNTTQKRPQTSPTNREYTRRVIDKRTEAEIVDIKCGRCGEIVLDSEGKVWVTGENSEGQGGNGTVSDFMEDTSKPVPGLTNIVKIAATSNSFAALQNDGTIWTWGCNHIGELGNGAQNSYSAVPVKVALPAIYGRIASLKAPGTVWTSLGTTKEELVLPTTVEVVLTDGTIEAIPVTWDLTGYDPQNSGVLQTFPGTLTLPDDLLNSLELVPQLQIRVRSTKLIITSIPTVTQEANQNIYLAPVNKTVLDEVPDTLSLPDTVTVILENDDTRTAELPVVWNTASYDPAQTGVQTLTGEVVIPGDSDVINPDDLRPTIDITVLPKQYEVWEASPNVILLSDVQAGTTLSKIQEQLDSEGMSEVGVRAVDLETDVEVLTFCNITLDEGDNPAYNSWQKDTPGGYELKARFPSNFIPLADDIPGPIKVQIISRPADIVSAELVRMNAPQSVQPQKLTGIPTQVNVTLENDKVVPVDVEWDWQNYDIDAVGEQIVLGTLVDLPSMAKQPDGKEIKAKMTVNTEPVSYMVSRLLSDNTFDWDAGLTLEEITALMEPTLTLEITSVGHDPVITTDYQVEVELETEKNPDFDPEIDNVYILSGTLKLPSNITCPAGSLYDEIILNTNAVEVTEVEPSYAMTMEGTAFGDITGLPDQVVVTLSCAGPDGVHKKAASGVDWGSGEGYVLHPTAWNEDGTVTLEVTGTLTDYPQYINGAGVEAKLYITVTQAFDLTGISPNRIPAEGAMEVKLGSSLTDIYNLLETHSVELTLQNSSGQTSTANVTFQLREEDNPDYDPLTVGTYTLKAYLPLDEAIRNPEDLGVEIVVKTMKYKITSTKVTRVTGVVSGTPFAEVGLPDTAPVVRSDGENEDVPVTWDGSKYNPTKIGSQVVKGTLVNPLPVHLENPNNRQPNAVVTIVDPSTQILSLEQLPEVMLLSVEDGAAEELPGLTEYRFWAQLLHEDGTVTEDVISVFVESE